MCAIVDANVASEVFGDARPPAGEVFFKWLASPRGQLVVGGKLREELSRNARLLRWLRTAIQYGRARSVPDGDVDDRAERLRREGTCMSDDHHVLALALVSGARLLYTNDNALIADFKNRAIVACPRGRIYTTARSVAVTSAHRGLLAAPDLCRPSRELPGRGARGPSRTR